MKKSEMLDHMYQDIIEAIASRASSNETDEKYWRRKVEGLLDMQLGFGMLPPMQPIPEYAFQAPNEWEPEDSSEV